MSPTLALCVTYAAAIGFQANWNHSYSECLSAAKSQGRPLIVLLEDPKRSEFRGDSLFIDNWQLLANFKLCRVDATSNYGKKVAELYGATTLPYTVITDRKCQEIRFRGAGKFSGKMWRETLTTHSPENFQIADASSIAFDGKGDSKPEEISAAKASYEFAAESIFPFADLDAALQRAHEKDQATLVFVSMDGCHYCDKMRAETFEDEEVISAVSEFQTVMIKRELNPAWVAKQGVKLFPTTIVVAADGSVTDRLEGFLNPERFRKRIADNRELAMVGEVY